MKRRKKGQKRKTEEEKSSTAQWKCGKSDYQISWIWNAVPKTSATNRSLWQSGTCFHWFEIPLHRKSYSIWWNELTKMRIKIEILEIFNARTQWHTNDNVVSHSLQFAKRAKLRERENEKEMINRQPRRERKTNAYLWIDKKSNWRMLSSLIFDRKQMRWSDRRLCILKFNSFTDEQH